MIERKGIERCLNALGEPTDAPTRNTGPRAQYWRSRALRRKAGVDDAA
jgi:hypothetical protein